MGLLIGLGAAKSGTTWLHRYLAAHPECHAGPVKEMHWFDSAEADSWTWRLKSLRTEIERARGRGERDRASRIARFAAHVERGERDDGTYLSILSEGAAPGALRFEITPAYSLLPEEALRRMAALEEGTARFLFVMRDPVGRMWSNLRMAAKRRGGSEGEIGRRAHDLMHAALDPDGADHRARSAYAAILPKLLAAIPRERLHLAFHEELFTQRSLDALTDFLGIARRKGALRRRVHTGRAMPLDDDLAARARVLLDPHYAATRRIMGRVPDAWMAHQEVPA